jgi:hypothetical protein
MHRVAWGVAGVATTLLLAGCGSNETMTESQTALGGLSGSIVVTSDSTAISALEHKIAALPGTGVTLSNGDKHSGAHVCGFSVGKNGHTYQVDAYGSLPASSCSASIQALFLANAP